VLHVAIDTGQFSESYLPILDGVSRVVVNYAYWLNRKYGKTTIVTPNYPEYIDNDRFDIIRYKSIAIPKRSPYRLGLPKFDKALKEKLSNQHFDIVHAHSPFSAGKIALKIANERNIPIVATFHSKFHIDLKASLKMNFLTNHFIDKIVDFYNQVDHVYTVNHSTIETLRSYGYKGKVEVIKNGTDYLYDHLNLIKDKAYINHLYDIDENTNVLLYVGQLMWHKNMKLIIEALVNLRKFRQKFKMIFIGDGNAREEMVKLVDEQKLNRFVLFVGEILDREQLQKYYSRANLFLFPSSYDTSGEVIREAASFRCPSLVLKDTNVSEGIKDNHNGYLSEDNSLSYAQRIISALNDRNKEKVGINAQQTLAITYEKIVDEVYEHYSEIVKLSKQY